MFKRITNWLTDQDAVPYPPVVPKTQFELLMEQLFNDTSISIGDNDEVYIGNGSWEIEYIVPDVVRNTNRKRDNCLLGVGVKLKHVRTGLSASFVEVFITGDSFLSPPEVVVGSFFGTIQSKEEDGRREEYIVNMKNKLVSDQAALLPLSSIDLRIVKWYTSLLTHEKLYVDEMSRGDWMRLADGGDMMFATTDEWIIFKEKVVNMLHDMYSTVSEVIEKRRLLNREEEMRKREEQYQVRQQRRQEQADEVVNQLLSKLNK